MMQKYARVSCPYCGYLYGGERKEEVVLLGLAEGGYKEQIKCNNCKESFLVSGEIFYSMKTEEIPVEDRASFAGWVSVEERKPDPDTKVSVRTSSGEELESYYGALIWSNQPVFFCNIGNIDKVTHWKPI